MAGRNRPPEKRGYVIAKDLKAAGPLVPQLQEAGYVKWAAGFADAANVMQWQDSLLDLLSEEYDFENEDEAGEINRMVAWLLLIRSTKGYEDLIEEEVQSGDKNFLAAYKNIYFEFNRVTTSNLNALCVDLYQATMDGTQLNVRSFAASLVRKSRKIDELAPGNGFSELQLLAVFMKGLPMEYKELVQHLSFKRLETLKEAVDITRDFAVANKLETEAGVNLTSSVSKKAHQVFSVFEAGGGGKARTDRMQAFQKDRKV